MKLSRIIFAIELVCAFLIIIVAILISKQFSSLDNAHQLFNSQKFHSAEIEYRKLRRLGIVDDQLYQNLSYIIYEQTGDIDLAQTVFVEDLDRGVIDVPKFITYRWQLANLSKKDVAETAQYLYTTDVIAANDYLVPWINSTTYPEQLIKLLTSQPDKFKQTDAFGVIYCIAQKKSDFLDTAHPLFTLCNKSAYTSKDRVDMIDYLFAHDLGGLVKLPAQELINSNSDFYQAYLFRALSYIQQDQWQLAASDLQRSSELAPTNTIVKFYTLLSAIKQRQTPKVNELITNLTANTFDDEQLNILYTNLSQAHAYTYIMQLAAKHPQVSHPLAAMVNSIFNRKPVSTECSHLLSQINHFELGFAYAQVDSTCKATDLGLLYDRSFLPNAETFAEPK